MTTLDQAFIKAYSFQGQGPARTVTDETLRPVPLAVALNYDTTLPLEPPGASAAAVLEALEHGTAAGPVEKRLEGSAGMPGFAHGEASAAMPANVLPGPPAQALYDSESSRSTWAPPISTFEAALTGPALDSPTAAAPGFADAEHLQTLAMAGFERPAAGSPPTQGAAAPGEHRPAVVADPVAAALAQIASFLTEEMAIAPVPADCPDLAALLQVPTGEPLPAVPPAPQSPQVPERSESITAGYQVDRFLWPEVCDRLAAAAGGELDRLAEGLAATATGQGRIVALIGCRRGEGVTTLTLCAARKLAARQQRTILVDVDLDDAQIGRRLGLRMSTGLDDVLAGRISLPEGVVESIADGLALLPLRQPMAATEAVLKYLAQDLQSLRAHYDVILLKLGPLGEESLSGDQVLRSLARHLDTAVVVHGLRSTEAAQLDRLCAKLEEQGVVEVGVAENFAQPE
jgi:Mrp family chromosome partitioning ATPase